MVLRSYYVFGKHTVKKVTEVCGTLRYQGALKSSLFTEYVINICIINILHYAVSGLNRERKVR